MSSFLDVVIPLAALSPRAAVEKLGAFLEMHLEVRLILVHQGALADLQGHLGAQTAIRVSHAVCDAGTTLFHRSDAGDWHEDAPYRSWVESCWKARDLERFVEWGIPKGMRRMLGGYSSHHLLLEVLPEHEPEPMRSLLQQNIERAWLTADVHMHGVIAEVVPKGVDRSTALRFLRGQGEPPPPTMVCAGSPADLDLLREATYPILLEGCGLDFETPGVPRDRTFMASQPGAFGVMEALLRWAFHQGLP